MRKVTCSACPLLCDDIIVKNGDFYGMCRHGFERIEARSSSHRLSEARIGATSADVDRAIEKLVDLLKNARKILVYGMDFSSNEALRLWVEICGKLRATIAARPRDIVFEVFKQGLDRYIANLDKVREFGDLVIVIECDPVDTITRIASRYLLYPRGERAPEGRESRVVMAIDRRRSRAVASSNYSIVVENTVDAIDRIAARIEGKGVAPPSGVSETRFELMVNDMLRAEQPVIVIGSDSLSEPQLLVSSIRRLIETLESRGKTPWLVALPSTTSGFAVAKMFREMFGSIDSYAYDFEQNTYIDPFGSRWSYDLVVAVLSEPLNHLPLPAMIKILNSRIAAIDYRKTLIARRAEIAIPVAIPGLEDSSSFTRLDGVEIHVEKVFDPPSGVISEIELAREILKRI